MTKLNIPLSAGLRFSERGSENSRFLDGSFTAKPGVLSTRKSHQVRYVLGIRPRKLLYSAQQNAVFSLTTNGTVHKDATLIDSGYSHTNGSLAEFPPNSDLLEKQLFIAADKMAKYDGATITNWGIDVPPDGALTAEFGGIVASKLINACDLSITWSFPAGTAVADEPTIKIQGTNSLKVTVTAATEAIIQTNAFPTLDFSVIDIIGFYVRFSNPAAIERFTISFDLDNSNFNVATAHRDFAFEFIPSGPAIVEETINVGITNPDSASGESNSQLTDASLTLASTLPATPNEWKHVIVGRDTFHLIGTTDWLTVYGMRVTMLSSVSQDIYFDIFYAGPRGQDDALGARYKYAYYSSATDTHSNLNLNPSAGIIGQNGLVNISGFTPPLGDAQITEYEVFRDVGGDGNYRHVGFLPLTETSFSDNISINQLGDLDLNNSSVPPRASLIVDYKGSVWLNDLSNKRRLWRSVPGRYESFSLQPDSGFFDVSVVGDEIIDMGIVGGNFYLVTKKSIIQVLAAELVPSFIEVVNLGSVSEMATYFYKDYLIFVNNTGIYRFDRANLTKLPHIETLFNPLSSDARAINSTTIESITLGSDAKHIWFSVGTSKMYVYSIDSNEWTEESIILVAHETDQIGFLHIAADINTVYNIYGSNNYEKLSIRSDRLELPTIGHINDIEIEYFSTVDLTVNVIIDGERVIEHILLHNMHRLWTLFNLFEILGQQVELEFISPSNGLTELYSCQINYTSLLDQTHYDSEYFKLPDERTAIVELYTKIYGLEDGQVEARVYVDDKVSRTILINLERNKISTLRHTIKPLVGTVGRVDLMGVRFSSISMTLNSILLGNGERRSIQLPAGDNRRARLTNDQADAKLLNSLEGLL
jgi:hypothetical protein